jgi:hypothetical protein
MTLPAPALEHVADLTVHVAQPLEAGTVTGTAQRGRRRIIPITGGRLGGPRLQGRVLPGGADFQLVVSDTLAVLDARYLIELQGPQFGGTHIYVHNRALRRASAADTARLLRGQAVDPAAIYFRCVPTFEVSHPALAWLTESVFVGTGARHPDRVELSIFLLA